MSENRNHTGRGIAAVAVTANGPQPLAQEQDQDVSELATTKVARRAEPQARAEDTQTRNVLMHRVIALNGDFQSPDSLARRPALVFGAQVQALPPNLAPYITPKEPVAAPRDLSATSLEWGGAQVGAEAEAADASKAAVALQQPSAPEVAPPLPTHSVDAQWATHSSIALQLCDDSPLAHRILCTNIEDAVTRQFQPALTASSSVTDLAGLDRALESAGVLQTDAFGLVTNAASAPVAATPATPASPSTPSYEAIKPIMFEVPAPLVWTVLGGFAMCAVLLAYLVTAFLICGHPSLFDLNGLRCVPGADVATVR